ncbi:MAG: hypothetical protein HYZ48_02785, partial [Chlamydiales bacterium]|nr:hypothetical protein [Chlamydiales bacterium]
VFIDILDREMAALHMYASGYYDLIGTPLSFFPNILLQDLEQKKLLATFPVAATKFLAFNTTSSPFQNVHIRKAFAYAISRKELIKHITQLDEKEALNILPPVLSSENTAYISDGDFVNARASLKKGLQELAIDDLGSIRFMYFASETNNLLAQELQQMWSRVLGVNVLLEHVEFKTLHERSKQGDFSIGLFMWVADYADPMSILDRFTDQANHRNYPKWENETYNRCLQDSLTAASYPEYIKNIRQAEKLLIDEMPLTCLFHENYAFLIHPHVQNFFISPLGHIYFDRIDLDFSKKKHSHKKS